MAYTYHDLKLKTVAELRDMAKDLKDDAVQGYSQMNKDRLLPALCHALHVEMLEHHVAVGLDKEAVKAKMRELKEERQRALEARPSVAQEHSTTDAPSEPPDSVAYVLKRPRAIHILSVTALAIVF